MTKQHIHQLRSSVQSIPLENQLMYFLMNVNFDIHPQLQLLKHVYVQFQFFSSAVHYLLNPLATAEHKTVGHSYYK